MCRTFRLAVSGALFCLFSHPAFAGGDVPALPLKDGKVLSADTLNKLVPPSQGVDIRSGDHHVFSVSKGKVTAVFRVVDTWCVLVRRERNYFVYARLHSASVCKGDSIVKGEQVGELDGTENVLQFQVWETMDGPQPVSWPLNEVLAFLKGVNE